MTITLRPLGDRVVVKPKPKDEVTLSGIVLPDTATEKPQEGSVLSVGPEYLVVRESDLLAIVTNGKK